MKGLSSLIIGLRVFHWCCVAHFAVSQIGCAKEIDLWLRTLPGNNCSLLGGVNQRVGNIGNALMAKCVKIGRERMNTEVQTRN